jgi:adenosine deaminase
MVYCRLIRTGDKMTVDESVIRALPKVELHIHLEGTFEVERLRTLSAERGVTPPMSLEEPLQFNGIGQFLGFLDWSCALMRTQADVEQVAYDYAARAKRDGTVYAEVIVNPTHWENLAFNELVEAIDAGFERAAGDGLADCRISVSLLRNQSAEEADRLVRWMISSRPRRVVALSVDGNEAAAGRTGPRFAPAYRLAGEAGLGLTAHAGESSGPEGVVDALDLLGVSRIDHGVRAIEVPDLVRRLADELITLNICPTSNGILLYPDFKQHPLPRLVEAGVPVTINTDDPALVGTTLVKDFAKAAELCDWDIEDLKNVSRTAVNATFCGPERQKELLALVDAFPG